MENVNDWFVLFNLEQKYRIRKNFTNTDEIEFIIKNEDENKQYLTGLKIIIKSSTEQNAKNKASVMVSHIVSLLGLNYGGFISSKMTNIYPSDAKTISVSSSITFRHEIGDYEKELTPIDFSMLSNLGKNSRLKHNVDFIISGIYSMDLGLFDMAIVQLRAATEEYEKDGKYDDLIKYKFLRNAVSHSNLRKNTEINVKKYFPEKFDFDDYDHGLKRTDKTNQNLQIEAYNLLNLTRDFILEKLR